jgi:two-component system response regulator
MTNDTKELKDFTAVDILIVEDNLPDAQLMLRALRKHNLANRVFVVEDGVAALDFLFCRGQFSERSAAHLPKIVLLDLKLPKVNGLEVLEQVKNDDRTRLIPVIVVTSSREDPDVQKAYDLGANSYVVKPVDFDQFMEAMSHLGLYWLLVNQAPPAK